MNKKDVMYVVLALTMMLVAVANAEQKEMYIWGERVSLEDNESNVLKESNEPIKPVGPYKGDNLQVVTQGKLKVLLYVYNDKTGAWDRAREEALKDMVCNKLRIIGISHNEEESYIDIGQHMKGE